MKDKPKEICNRCGRVFYHFNFPDKYCVSCLNAKKIQDERNKLNSKNNSFMNTVLGIKYNSKRK